MYKNFRYLNTDVHIYEQTNEKIRLLQNDRLAPLSLLRLDGQKPKVVINCSYFTPQYVLGRNQGDLHDSTYNSKDDYKWCDIVFFNDGSYKVGKFSSGEYRDNVIAGFSPAVIAVNGELMFSEPISSARSRLTSRSPQTAIAITNTNKLIMLVSEGRNVSDTGLTGEQVFDFLGTNYDTKVMALLDGGGSSEMIVNDKVMNFLSDGRERPMWNGLALFTDKDGFGYVEEEFTPNELIKQDLIDESKYAIKCPYEMKPTYITIHNTANKASAQAEISYMKSNNNEVSYHVAVDDKEAIQGIPFNRNAWHCGDSANGKGNRNSIGIEICYSTDYESDRHEKAFMKAVEVTKYLMKKFNIPVSNVVQHNHWNGKNCPHRIREEGTWDKFIGLLSDELKYEIGQKVKFNRIATSAFATADKEPRIKEGEITRIYKGANYPYLIGEGQGFVNDSCITGLVDDLEAKIKALESEIENLKEKHKEEIKSLEIELNQTKASLKAINQYATEIVKLSN